MFVKKTWEKALIVIGVGLVIFLNQPVNSLMIKEATKSDLITIKKLQEGDIIVLSHINSIYDAEVKEVFKVRKNFFVLKDVDTSSWGVKEYYGIADGIPERRFYKISFRNTSGRNFTLRINRENIEEISRFRDRILLIEVKSIKKWEYYWNKLKVKLNKEVLP